MDSQSMSSSQGTSCPNGYLHGEGEACHEAHEGAFLLSGCSVASFSEQERL